MEQRKQLVIFNLDDQRFALPLRVVERTVRVAEVTRLPGAPAIVIGVIRIAGEILPVFNVRRRFGLPEREIRLTDEFLIARTDRRLVALIVDSTHGVLECAPDTITPASGLMSNLPHVHGIATMGDDLVLIHDLEKFLTEGEGDVLEKSLEQEALNGR